MGEKKAVALKYRRDKDNAPKVVAKGKGALAERIVQLAREHGVKVVEDENLVEFLMGLEIGEEIPPELYRAVAEILAYIYSATRRGTP
ncbi:MAG: EscU/YscU/HrcU family type III secretion system export apparatus switch protein [Desulfurobacteriaceae bacterium]